MTTNKIASTIVKLFFQTNNQYEACNQESQIDFFEVIGGAPEIFDIDFLGETTLSGGSCKAIINQSIFIHLTNELSKANSSDKVFAKFFKRYDVQIVLILKFGKKAQVKRKSI